MLGGSRNAAEPGGAIKNRGNGGDPVPESDFDRHVIGRAFLHAAVEAQRLNEPVPDRLGVDEENFNGLVRFLRLGEFVSGAGKRKKQADDEELMVRQLLMQNLSSDDAIGEWLSSIIARRSMEANHLWEDIGLAARSDLSRLLNRHFGGLAGKNTRNMRWKKFLYRALCESEGFTMCPSPTCDACSEFDICYSDESGASALARNTRQVDNPN